MPENKILISTVIQQYNVEIGFVQELQNMGRIDLLQENDNFFILEDQLSDFEKMLRMNVDLNINAEGIDTIFHLLDRMDALQNKIVALSERLSLLDNDDWDF